MGDTVKPNLIAFVVCWMSLEPSPKVFDEIDNAGSGEIAFDEFEAIFQRTRHGGVPALSVLLRTAPPPGRWGWPPP